MRFFTLLLCCLSEEITVLNWNLLGLPIEKAAVRPWPERIDGIAEQVRSVNADLVLFQESFEKGLSIGLYERLNELYPFGFIDIEGPSEGVMPSGLALFSKIPFRDLRFTPHPNLLDSERDFNMGMVDFVLIDKHNEPLAHIAASHFQGSSCCAWRKGVTSEGKRLDYAQIREEEAQAILNLSAPENVPRYVIGDLNVDRRSSEYYTSCLNANVNKTLFDKMTPEQQTQASSTTYFKHLNGLSKMYPDLSEEDVSKLAVEYKRMTNNELAVALKKKPWTLPISEFSPSLFATITGSFHPQVWDYFVATSEKAIAFEIDLWKKNGNEGAGPPASMAEVMQIRALPFEEALDYILGINDQAIVYDIAILEGYSEIDQSKTLSDHCPVFAKIAIK